VAKLAKSSRKKPKSDQPEVVEENDLVAETEADKGKVEADEEAQTSEPDNAAEGIEDAEVLDDTPVESESDGTTESTEESDAGPGPDEVDIEAEPDQPAASQGDADPATTPVATQQPRRRGVFVPLLIGGLAAGGLGYGVETYLDNQQAAGPDLAALIEEQSGTIDALRAEIDAIPPAPDLTPLRERITALESAVSDEIGGLETSLSDRIDAMDARLSEVEKRPGSDGTLSDSALAAYERELDALRADLAAQRQEVTAIADQAAEDLNAARAEAEEIEQEALREARAAAGRAALNRLRGAVETGDPFAELLGDLEPVAGDLPVALTSVAETGVATRATLEDEFGPAARAALAAAREEGVAGESGGLGSFLRQQFDVRSTQPREGSDPDAVLSRAEAAVESDRLSDALAEIATLPEVSRAEMTDWTAKAQTRADALAAISDLSETLNTN